MTSRVRYVGFALLLAIAAACNAATTPGGTLGDGRWTGDGACLAIVDAACNFVAGCGHGQFKAPALRSDGTFDVDGTYRIEAGPISQDPAPPAHFSGLLAGSLLTLTVVPTVASLMPATYTVKPASAGVCSVPCL